MSLLDFIVAFGWPMIISIVGVIVILLAASLIAGKVIRRDDQCLTNYAILAIGAFMILVSSMVMAGNYNGWLEIQVIRDVIDHENEKSKPEIDFDFWEELEKPTEDHVFKDASLKWKVPEDILRAVYVKETLKGTYLGEHLAYMQVQDKNLHLEALKRIASENDLDYREIKGSRSGAIGFTQFMPLWWEHYGVDANENGRRDPFDLYDAVHTSARFLREHKNKKGTWWSAIKCYNHDSKYVTSVLRIAEKVSGEKGKYIPLT